MCEAKRLKKSSNDASSQKAMMDFQAGQLVDRDVDRITCRSGFYAHHPPGTSSL